MISFCAGTLVKNEEGGMRFVKKTMLELDNLLVRLGLWKTVVPFGSGDLNNRFYLRGCRFTMKQALDIRKYWFKLYNLGVKRQQMMLSAKPTPQQPGDILIEVRAYILSLPEVRLSCCRWLCAMLIYCYYTF